MPAGRQVGWDPARAKARASLTHVGSGADPQGAWSTHPSQERAGGLRRGTHHRGTDGSHGNFVGNRQPLKVFGRELIRSVLQVKLVNSLLCAGKSQ